MVLAAADDWYTALKIVRRVMSHEAAVLGLDMATGLPVPGAGPSLGLGAAAAG